MEYNTSKSAERLAVDLSDDLPSTNIRFAWSTHRRTLMTKDNSNNKIINLSNLEFIDAEMLLLGGAGYNTQNKIVALWCVNTYRSSAIF